MSAGEVKIRKNNGSDAYEGSFHERIMGSFRGGATLIMVLAISATMLAIMPVSANLIAEPAPSAAIDQPSGCPCSGGCGTAPASQDSQAENTEINAIGQVAQTDNSPARTVQQPVESAPAVTAETIAVDRPTSVVPEINDASLIADTTGSFSSDMLMMAMPSWWLNREQGSDTPYSLLDRKPAVQPLNVGTVFTGWQKGSSGMFSPLFTS